VDVQAGTQDVTLVLSKEEQRLLRRALERALFIDTPPAEQGEIAAFCSRLLGSLPGDDASTR